MIIAACGGRGNGEKNAEGLARAESGEGSGKWEVGRVTGRRVDGEGWMATGRGGGWRQGGGIWKGATGRERWGGEQSQHKKASNHHANLPLEMYSFTL